MTASAPLTRSKVLALAVPIMAANIATPLVGLVDIAVIGRTGTTADIAAVALGALIFNLLFWAFGFLRMGSTALTAQADGAGDEGEVRAALWRAVMAGLAIGAVFVLAQWPVRELVFLPFSATPEIEAAGKAYFDMRIWGSPAALAGFAIYGWLIGLGRTGAALALQVVLNVTNAGLSIGFVYGFEMGVEGVALASALALWIHVLAAIPIIARVLARRAKPQSRGAGLFDRGALGRLFAVNRDIFIRTLALLAGFLWFNEASLRLGPEMLAGNAVLLQFIAITAYFLDAFAHVTETVTGKAAGRRDWPALTRAFRLSSEQAGLFALGLSALLLFAGDAFITGMTTDEATRAVAMAYLPFAAAAPLVGLASWQLDGLMIGATRGALMRNAMLASLAIYLALDFALRPALGGTGLWLAFLGYYAARAVTLGVGWPGLKRDMTA
jgi:MATE family multidrug resistance protein